MPTVVIQPNATIFVTGVNGLIGSYVAEQLLARGYNVRGAVRNVEKSKWLKEYFDGKSYDAKFELVEVPDMTVEGCYDDLLEGKFLFPRRWWLIHSHSVITRHRRLRPPRLTPRWHPRPRPRSQHRTTRWCQCFDRLCEVSIGQTLRQYLFVHCCVTRETRPWS
jgi:hypothetical protein